MMKDWKTIYSVKGPTTMMEMTTVELMEAMKETKTIILSFGAIENHGAHLPLGADYYQAEALIRCTYEALLEKGHKTIPGFAVPFGTQTNQFERQGEHLVGNAYLFEKVFIDMTACVMATVPELVHLENAKPYYAPEDGCPMKMGGLYYYGGSVGVFTPVEKYLDHSPGYIGDPADATAEEGIVCLEQYAKWIAQAAEKYLF